MSTFRYTLSFLYVIALVPLAAAAQSYTLTDLGALGGDGSMATSINNSGTVVGYLFLSGNQGAHAFSYSGGTMRDLGTLGGRDSFADGISDSGTVAGSSFLPDQSSHAFSYSGGTMNDLGTLGGNYVQVHGINNSGIVVGYSRLPGNQNGHAFSYSGGTMHDLGTLGGFLSYAYGVNNSGTVVGDSLLTGDGTDHAFSYSGGTMSDLGTLGGNNSAARGINDSGTVVGWSSLPGNQGSHAFSYSSGTMHDLGTLGGDYSYAFGINESGTVVGYSSLQGNGVDHAFVFNSLGLRDLNNIVSNGAGWTINRATAINNVGQIVGSGINPSGNYQAILLTPILVAVVPIAALPVIAGQTTTLNEMASGGTRPLSYSWYQGASGDISNPVGNNEPTFTTSSLTTTTTYWVRVSDSGGQTSDSPALTVTVVPVGFGLGTVLDCPGAMVTVPFTATGFHGLGSFQGSFHWDPTVVTYLGLTASGVTSFGPDNTFLEPDGATLNFEWHDGSSLAGTTVPDGITLFALNFQIIGTPGTSTPVVVTNQPTAIEVTDARGDVLDVAFTSGQVVANGQLSLGGSIRYYGGTNVPVPNVEVDVSGGETNSTNTGSDGSFALTVPSCLVPSVNLTPTLDTDAPTTTGVSMLDVFRARAHILDQHKLTSPFALLAADVNGSKTITGADLRMISLFVIQLTNFTAENGKLWRFIPANYVFPDPISPWSAPGFLSYTGLETNVIGQDFIAVKLGDVDGSWPDIGASPNTVITGSDTRAGTIHLHAEDTLSTPGDTVRVAIQLSAAASLVNPGDTVQVAVQVSQVEQLTTAQFTLQWNPAVLEYIGTEGYALRGLGAENFGPSRIAQGQLDFGWDDPGLTGVTVGSGQRLFGVQFKVVGNPGQGSWVEVKNAPTSIELSVGGKSVSTSTSAGVVGVRAATPGTLGVLAYGKNQLDLWYEALADSVWAVQSSPDLTHWSQAVPPSTAPSSSVASVSLSLPASNHQYYRAVRVK